LVSQQEKERFSTPPATAPPMRDCHNSANEKPLYFELPVYSKGLFVYNTPPYFSLSSVKEHSSLLFSGLAYGFALPGLSWIAILCYSQINPFFAGKTTAGFIFNVDKGDVPTINGG